MSFDDVLFGDSGDDAGGRAVARRGAKQREKTAQRDAADTQGVQLSLIEGAPALRRDWVLDTHTRRVGRQGVEAARAALRRATPPDDRTSHAA